MLCKDGSIYKQFLAACAVPPQHGTTYRVSNNLTYMYNEFSDSLEFVGVSSVTASVSLPDLLPNSPPVSCGLK